MDKNVLSQYHKPETDTVTLNRPEVDAPFDDPDKVEDEPDEGDCLEEHPAAVLVDDGEEPRLKIARGEVCRIMSPKLGGVDTRIDKGELFSEAYFSWVKTLHEQPNVSDSLLRIAIRRDLHNFRTASRRWWARTIQMRAGKVASDDDGGGDPFALIDYVLCQGDFWGYRKSHYEPMSLTIPPGLLTEDELIALFLVFRRYGDGDGDKGLTQRQAAVVIGVSQPYISQLIASAKRKIRKHAMKAGQGRRPSIIKLPPSADYMVRREITSKPARQEPLQNAFSYQNNPLPGHDGCTGEGMISYDDRIGHHSPRRGASFQPFRPPLLPLPDYSGEE